MKYLIGIDGGGTKTDCIVTDINGNFIFQTKGEPSNFLVHGTGKVSESILNLIDKCRKQLNFLYDEIEVILIGTAGAGRVSDAGRFKESFLNYLEGKGIHFKKFIIESDARIALEGAFSGGPGAILIAGTGSIMFGKDSMENIHRVGGFGRQIGDEGSGFSIGKKGLNAAAREMDGRGESTLISKLIKEKFSIITQENLITEIYKNNFDIASAAPIVISAAEANDKAALKIIDEETDELILHISAMKKKFTLPELNLSMIGSLVTKDNLYSKTLKEKIKNFPGIKLQKADHSPAEGAILMAKKIINRQ